MSEVDTKWCPRAEHWVPVTGFTKNATRKDGLSSYCKACRRNIHVKRFYKLTPEQYAKMKADQANRCAICGNEPTNHELPVDHDHLTGEVRGLLCVSCNRALGYIENGDWLKSALAYLGKENA